MRSRNLFRVLLKKSFYSREEKNLIEKAFTFARSAHIYQKRRSGEPYWTHVVGVAIKLILLGFPSSFVVASLLHDCVEDANISIREISLKFGAFVAFLVDFMTRENCGYRSYEDKVNFILSEYPWAIFLRLSDISHNMETPQYYKRATEKIEEAIMFKEVAEKIAISKGEEVLKGLNPNAFPNGIFGFIQRLEDKIEKAKLINKL